MPLNKVAVVNRVVPFFSCTLPVGAALLEPVTEAEKVTGLQLVAGLADEVSVTFVAAAAVTLYVRVTGPAAT